MDSTTYGAATSALFWDEAEARRWFQLVAEQVGALDEDAGFDDACEVVRQGAEAAGLGWAAESLLDYLGAESTDPVGVLRELADPAQAAELVEANLAAAAYAQEATGTDEPVGPAAEVEEDAQEGTSAPFDDAAWAAYLAQWQEGWDGAEQSWPAFKESFLYHAPDAVRSAAEQLVTAAEASDKVEVLTPYGIAAAPPAAAAEAVTEAGAAAQADQVIAAVLQDNPELVELGADRLQELFAEVVAELAAERQTAEGGTR